MTFAWSVIAGLLVTGAFILGYSARTNENSLQEGMAIGIVLTVIAHAVYWGIHQTGAKWWNENRDKVKILRWINKVMTVSKGK